MVVPVSPPLPSVSSMRTIVVKKWSSEANFGVKVSVWRVVNERLRPDAWVVVLTDESYHWAVVSSRG